MVVLWSLTGYIYVQINWLKRKRTSTSCDMTSGRPQLAISRAGKLLRWDPITILLITQVFLPGHKATQSLLTITDGFFPCSSQDSKPPLPSTGKPIVTTKDGGNKQQIRDTIRMIVRGTLGSCSSSSECMCFSCAFVILLIAASWFCERMFLCESDC